MKTQKSPHTPPPPPSLRGRTPWGLNSGITRPYTQNGAAGWSHHRLSILPVRRRAAPRGQFPAGHGVMPNAGLLPNRRPELVQGVLAAHVDDFGVPLARPAQQRQPGELVHGLLAGAESPLSVRSNLRLASKQARV